jgi:hypothetical protein
MLLLSSCEFLDLLGQGLCTELQPGGLQGPAYSGLDVQLQVLLILVEHRPVGQVLTVGVPVDMTTQ